MDRLPLVILLAACSGGEKPAAPATAPSRVDAVAAAPKKEASTGDFCESRPNLPFAFPELDSPVPGTGTGWRWVNVWATWCAPCIEEMPRLAAWEQKLSADGAPVDVQFLSVDAAAEDVTKFRATHPTTPESVRIKDLSLLSPWLKSVGQDDSAVLPLHLFVNPEGNIACTRMGAVNDTDYAVVKAVLSGK